MTKIIEFETSVVSLPREEGPLTGGMGSKADFITIKLRTSDGLEGISLQDSRAISWLKLSRNASTH